MSQVAGLRSGQALMLNFTEPCPATLEQSDCEAVWLDWGECESSDSRKVMRYTVEREATAGGAACEHLDGYQERHAC
jgi:hypothetical protein